MHKMSRQPILSIVTPVLNAAEFLPTALASVEEASRHGAEIEHIIVDGGSTDGSLEIAQSARDSSGTPIVEIFSGEDSGQSQAINRGVAVARGRYVGWLNADDVYLSSGLVMLVADMARSDADVVLGRCRFVDRSGRSRFVPSPPDPVTPESLLRLISGWFAGRSIVQPEAFVRREVFDRLGGVDESLHYTMDYHLWLRLAASNASFQAEPIEVAHQIVHDAQKTADNLAVVREMLLYADGFLSDRPESPEREQAEREIERIRARARLANRLREAIAPHGSLSHSDIVMHGRRPVVSESLLEGVGVGASHGKRCVFAGLKPDEIGRAIAWLRPGVPHVVAGRLPLVASAFDLIITTVEAIPSNAAGSDVLNTLRPGGTLCILGATPGIEYQDAAARFRKAVADSLTFAMSRSVLDRPGVEAIAQVLSHPPCNMRVLRLPDGVKISSLTPEDYVGGLASWLRSLPDIDCAALMACATITRR